MNLTPAARACLTEYRSNLSKGYETSDLSAQFSVSPKAETHLRQALLDSVEFLSLITCMDVDQINGQVVSVGGHGLTTGRNADGRFSTENDLTGNTYQLVETDSCAYVTWATLAAWANAGTSGQFIKMMSKNASERYALDMLRVGFNGVSAAASTDPVTNPMGEDVNKGWHQLVKEKAPEQIVTDPIYFNPSLPDNQQPKQGEYRTADAIVMEMKALLPPHIRNDPRLRVLIGADIVAASQSRLMDQANKPSEHIAAQQLEKSIGGIPALIPPFFPAKRIVLTIPSNLHCYTQKGTRSRKSENSEDRKRYEDKYWRMEGFALDEYQAYAAVDEANFNIGAAPAS